MSKIETGVDKLVSLINVQEKISITEAAKKLGVSPVVIQEWADFLEEEEIISIEYKFSKTILVQRKLSNKELKEKTKEFGNEKDAFLRKVESSLKGIDIESMGLEKIKKEFFKLKKDIGQEIFKVKDELTELEKYESLKKGLDKKLQEQQQEFHKILDKAHLQIQNENKKYQELLENLEIEKREFKIKEQRLKSLEDKEIMLREKMKAIYGLADTVKEKIEQEKKDIGSSEERINRIEVLTDAIEEEIKQKKKKIEPLLKKTDEQNKKIFDIQKRILHKAKDSTSKIKEDVTKGEIIAERFKKIFEKKKEIGLQIEHLDKDHLELKEELEKLSKKAMAVDLSDKSISVNEHMVQLEKELKKVEKKKENFKSQVQKLIKLVNK